MKHIPERHQSVAPPASFIAAISMIITLMAIIYLVVALADR